MLSFKNDDHRKLQRLRQHVLQSRVRLLQRDHRSVRRHQVVRERTSTNKSLQGCPQTGSKFIEVLRFKNVF